MHCCINISWHHVNCAARLIIAKPLPSHVDILATAAAAAAVVHQVRRLNQELVAKERCIASLQAANRLHKQQLQQLATSATDAGLMVTPQHLLHVADDKTPACTKGYRPAAGAFQAATSGAVATAAGASRIPSRPLPVRPASAASGAAVSGTPVKASLPCKLTSGAGAEPSTPLAGRGQQATSRIPAATGCDAGSQSGLQAAAAAGAKQSGISRLQPAHLSNCDSSGGDSKLHSCGHPTGDSPALLLIDPENGY